LSHTIKSKLQAKAVDFSTVLKMIDDMVVLLKKEGDDDEKHKTFCDAEFDSSADEKKAAEEKLESLASAISEMKDEIASLKDAIVKTTDEVTALDKSVAEATAQRKKEHSEYTEMIQLNEAAIQLVFKAENRLQKFYNPAMYKAPEKREPTAEERAVMAAGGEVDLSVAPQYIAGTTQTVFIQEHQQTEEAIDPPTAPETYGEHKKKSGKSNGVIALLKGLTNDLEKEIQEAEHDEKVAERDYKELMADAEETKEQNLKSIADKESTKAEVEGKLQDAKTQSAVTTEAYTGIKAYIADLHSSCDFIVAQFEVRKDAREKEVESLKNAKAVLSGASYSF
jgi:predicted  nucleic acid-binding Zn-ribbon protein